VLTGQFVAATRHLDRFTPLGFGRVINPLHGDSDATQTLRRNAAAVAAAAAAAAADAIARDVFLIMMGVVTK
jgi:hypothetical protein